MKPKPIDNNVLTHRWAGPWLNSVGYALGVVTVLAVGIAIEVRGCSGDAQNATKIIEAAGYHDVLIHGPERYRCAEDDLISNTFEAVSTTGAHVRGVVCCGAILKSCTLRFDP